MVAVGVRVEAGVLVAVGVTSEVGVGVKVGKGSPTGETLTRPLSCTKWYWYSSPKAAYQTSSRLLM